MTGTRTMAEGGELLSRVEILALKKLAIIVGALASTFKGHSAKRETQALLSVLVAVTNRLEAQTISEGKDSNG